MFQVLQRNGMPGLIVSAVDLAKTEPLWQTWLAAPLVAEPHRSAFGQADRRDS